MNKIAIIPARGGSVGIPRKNMRILNGKPLITYVIQSAQKTDIFDQLIVATDDSEIAMYAESLGCTIYTREKVSDLETLDTLIYNIASGLSLNDEDILVTLQPTSPHISSRTILESIKTLENQKTYLSSVLTVKKVHGLFWRKKDAYTSYPLYSERVNRQSQITDFVETGGLIACFYLQLRKFHTRISEKPQLIELFMPECIDIDDQWDWSLCENAFQKKEIYIFTIGDSLRGMGHVVNMLTVASNFVFDNLTFFVDEISLPAYTLLSKSNYNVKIHSASEFCDVCINEKPDIIIVDKLDNSQEFMLKLKSAGSKIVSFEDLGEGSVHSDIVINAIYKDSTNDNSTYSGFKYFVLPSKFSGFKKQSIRPEVQKVMIMYGGSDPQDYSNNTVIAIQRYCIENNISIDLILGHGYKHKLQRFEESLDLKIHYNSMIVPKLMRDSCLLYTSAGRSCFEASATLTPSIVSYQNSKEATHPFASDINGFKMTKLSKPDRKVLYSSLISVAPLEIRLKMFNRLQQIDLESGTKRVCALINSLRN